MGRLFPTVVRLVSISLVMGCVFFGFDTPIVGIPQANAQECSVDIIAPKPGGKVRIDALVSGTANIAANSYLWVLAHRKGLKGWWPQGGGEADVKEGKWEVLVTFGKPGEIGTFEVAVVVVDKQTNEDLKRWVEDAPRKNYPSFNFPNPVEGCSVKTVLVDKVGD
ncbi:MAG: hypothetical protein WC156_04575 [Pedobacter sp.]